MSGDNSVAPDALLERISRALKSEIGPAVGEAYPKTQAFMASVVLQKLAGELRLAEAHAAQNRADTQALAEHLLQATGTGASVPAPVRVAIEGLHRELDAPALTRLVEALYAARGELGAERFDALLGRVRGVLRARVDRALEYSA